MASQGGLDNVPARAVGSYEGAAGRGEMAVTLGEQLLVPRADDASDQIRVVKMIDHEVGLIPSNSRQPMYAKEVGVARVLSDFMAERHGELSVTKGEIVTLLQSGDDDSRQASGWQLAALCPNGEPDELQIAKIGFLPAAYVSEFVDDSWKAAVAKAKQRRQGDALSGCWVWGRCWARGAPKAPKITEEGKYADAGVLESVWEDERKRKQILTNKSNARKVQDATSSCVIDPRKSNLVNYWDAITTT